jgi:hypothetical protein
MRFGSPKTLAGAQSWGKEPGQAESLSHWSATHSFPIGGGAPPQMGSRAGA